MITHLRIKNYALIEHLEMSPSGMLNIVTGETGAGKSIMLGAVGLLLGNRADTKVLSDDKQKCIIEGEFDLSQYQLKTLFERQDLDYEDSSIFRREISTSGKSRAFINDTPVTLETMKSIGKYLLNIHSQHQTLELGQRNFQLQLIDYYTGNESLLFKFRQMFDKYNSTNEELQHLIKEQVEANEKLDYEAFLLDELEKANFREGEQEELEQELSVLEHAEEIKGALFNTAQILSESEYSTLASLQEAKSNINSVQKLSSKYGELFQRIDSVFIELQDLTNTISNDEQAVDIDPQRLLEVQERLSLLFKLQQKHSVQSIGELLDIKENISDRVIKSSNLGEEIGELEKRTSQLLDESMKLAQELSDNRLGCFSALKHELEDLLKGVGMEDSVIEIERIESELSYNGIDSIGLKFTANKGILPKPISQVASGGELSRLMFCIKYILAQKMALPTVIFDEIDTGISGEIALKMGRMMQEMSKRHQVITITHLPQMAAYGDSHYFVYKDNSNHVVKSLIKELKEEERRLEIAKMIGGEQPSEAAFESAKELLLNATKSLN